MPDFPLPVWTPAYIDIFDGARIVADEAGLPQDLMLGLCYAECGDALQSFDRWHRWTTEALVYIERQDRNGLEGILQRCAAIPTNDISFGPCHQTWRWSPEYNGNPYDLQAILEFRVKYIQDHGHALRVARDQIARLWATHGPDKVETLCRYNKPDGTASGAVRQRYANMLVLAAQQLGTPTPSTGDVVYENFRDPAPAGRFGRTPKGIILHGSRSGIAGNPKDREYTACANWEVNNPNDLGWNATIGERKVAIHLPPQEWGWNARAASDDYLAVEFAQATVDDPITDAQVTAFADWVKTRVLVAWPGLPMHMPTHAEVEKSGETGQVDGKSDVFPAGDSRADELRSRIMAALNIDSGPPPPDTKALIAAQLAIIERATAEIRRLQEV